MSARRNRWLVGLFPRGWRERYAEEFLALLDAEHPGFAGAADIVKAAAFAWAEHLLTRRRYVMPAGFKSLLALSAKPSALLPMLMSSIALALVLGHVFIDGGRHEADEGAIAHVFQGLVVAQVPVTGFFLIRWIRRNPRACLAILGLQVLMLAAALFPVWYFRL